MGISTVISDRLLCNVNAEIERFAHVVCVVHNNSCFVKHEFSRPGLKELRHRGAEFTRILPRPFRLVAKHGSVFTKAEIFVVRNNFLAVAVSTD